MLNNTSGLAMLVFAAAPWGIAAEKPNIVYILADDMGPGDVQAYNKDGKIPTPNIDRLAREGMKFMDAHTNSSVCTPTRYGILTGRYAWRTELKQGVLGGYNRLLIDPARETVASFLKKHGYRTACLGKWHLGMDWSAKDVRISGRVRAKDVDCSKPVQSGPLDVGFDYFFGMNGSLNMSPHAFIDGRHLQGTLEYVDSIAGLDERGFVQPAKTGWVAEEYQQDQVLSTLTENACAWVRENADSPFFLYLPLPSPHSPIVPRQEFVGKSGLNLHGDFCMETDWVVGEVLDVLDEVGVAENTILVFTSDNGTSPKAKVKEMQEKGHYSSWVYRGLKGTLWEGGHRMPFVVRWPAQVNADSTCDQTICTTDLLATCADLLDARLADDAGEDSVSFLPALMGREAAGVDSRLIVHHSDKGFFAVRRGKWKLMLHNAGGSNRRNPKDKPVINPAEVLLFDMENDVVASTNYSSERPEVVEELKSALAQTIQNGRSTPGAGQPTDLHQTADSWRQIDPIRSYLLLSDNP